MKGFLILGKCLTLLFWWVVLLNLFMPMVKPFHALINLAGGTLLLLHVIEVVAFNKRLRGQPSLARSRADPAGRDLSYPIHSCTARYRG